MIMSETEQLFSSSDSFNMTDYFKLPNNKVGSIETMLFETSKSVETKSILSDCSQACIPFPVNFSNNKIMNDYNVFRHTNNYSKELLECPMCFNQRKNLFCHNCIKNGDFTHSKKNFLERFADKKLKFIKFKGQQKQLSLNVQNIFCKIILKENLNLKIRKLDSNCKILQKLISDKKLLLEELKSALDCTKRDQFKCRQKQINLKTRIKEIKDKLAKQSVAINNCILENSKFDLKIRNLLREKILSLSTNIFSINEELFECLDNSGDNSKVSLNSESTPLLCSSDDDDFKINARPTNRLKFVKIKIVEPWVGLNENYHSYFFQNTRAAFLEIHENNFRNDEYRITSALSYLCHLTNLIAMFCDINLPKKILFSEFYFKEIKKDDFLFKIAKLNANILFLCIYHHMDTQLINPHQSFKNIELLLRSDVFVGVLDNHIEISNNVLNAIQENLFSDLSSIGKEAILFNETAELNDDNGFDFVESNIPDLNFSSLDQPSNILSIFSSFYKRATKN